LTKSNQSSVVTGLFQSGILDAGWDGKRKAFNRQERQENPQRSKEDSKEERFSASSAASLCELGG
jgi:hypothetical protein